MEKEINPFIQECYADNGEHSHWELHDLNTGDIIWSEEIEDNKGSEAVVDFEKLINDYWLFDNYQQPMSGWHDKQLLLEVIRKLKK